MANVSLSPTEGTPHALWVKVRLSAYHETKREADYRSTGPICVSAGAASLPLIY